MNHPPQDSGLGGPVELVVSLILAFLAQEDYLSSERATEEERAEG